MNQIGRALAVSAATVMAIGVAAAAAGLLLAQVAPQTTAAGVVISRAPVAAASARLADAAMAAHPPDLEAAKAHTQREILAAPGRVNPWLRLAYLDGLARGGRLGPEGVDALAHSYALAPADEVLARWRLRFALEVWGDLTPEVRSAAAREIRILWSRPRSKRWLRSLAPSIVNPTGRLALNLQISILQRGNGVL